MIKHAGQFLTNYARSTAAGQLYIGISESVSAKLSPSILWAQEKIQTFNSTQDAVKGYHASLQSAKIDMPWALTHDGKTIKEAAAVLANQILIISRPSDGFNSNLTKYYQFHQKDFPASLVREMDSDEDLTGEEYIRKEHLKLLTSNIESRMLQGVKDHTLFTTPMKAALSDNKGLAASDSIFPLTMEGISPMPHGLHTTITYERGHLKTELHPKQPATPERSYPLPRVKSIETDVTGAKKAFDPTQGTILGRVMNLFYKSDNS